MIEGPRPARPSEYPSLLRLINSCLFMGKKKYNMEEVYPGHLSMSNLANLWVMVEDGKVVSHVGVSKCLVYVHGVRIPVVLVGSVATDPAYRKLGLASRMLEHVKRRHDRQGYDLYMISGDRGLYHRIGAAKAGRMFHYLISGSALRPFGHPDVVARPAVPSDLKEIASLYRREKLHVVRNPGIYRRVFRSGWAAFTPAKFYVAEAEGEITAYFVATVTGRLGRPLPGRLSVIEAGGSRTDLLAGLDDACRKWGKRRVELSVSASDRDTLAILSGRHLGENPVEVYDCTAIINFPRLVARLRPLLVARAGAPARAVQGIERQGKMELHLGPHKVALPPEAMVRLIFGEPLRDRPAGVHADGTLGGLLRKALPVPLANPGINYM